MLAGPPGGSRGSRLLSSAPVLRLPPSAGHTQPRLHSQRHSREVELPLPSSRGLRGTA